MISKCLRNTTFDDTYDLVPGVQVSDKLNMFIIYARRTVIWRVFLVHIVVGLNTFSDLERTTLIKSN